MPLDLNYYYGNEADQYSFYRVPKTLLTDPRYKGVSVEAKVLYGLLLDRMSLSIKNNWMDSDGRVYIYFMQEDAMSLMDCGKDKATKLFREPERKKSVVPGKDFIRIAGDEVASGVVKSRFLKLNHEHIAYVLDCLNSNITLVLIPLLPPSNQNFRRIFLCGEVEKSNAALLASLSFHTALEYEKQYKITNFLTRQKE